MVHESAGFGERSYVRMVIKSKNKNIHIFLLGIISILLVFNINLHGIPVNHPFNILPYYLILGAVIKVERHYGYAVHKRYLQKIDSLKNQI